MSLASLIFPSKAFEPPFDLNTLVGGFLCEALKQQVAVAENCSRSAIARMALLWP